MQRKIAVEVTQALCNYPYFILNNEIKTGINLFKQELREIQQNYIDYRKGVEFATEGTSGDYVPSMIRFKQTKSLIDKQARFMFSQTPDINIQETGTDDKEEEQIKQYQKFVDENAFWLSDYAMYMSVKEDNHYIIYSLDNLLVHCFIYFIVSKFLLPRTSCDSRHRRC